MYRVCTTLCGSAISYSIVVDGNVHTWSEDQVTRDGSRGTDMCSVPFEGRFLIWEDGEDVARLMDSADFDAALDDAIYWLNRVD